MRSTFAGGVLLAIVLHLSTPLDVTAQEADPSDVASIDAIIAAVYDVISGEAGEPRDWARWHSLFAEGATLSAITRTPSGEIGRVRMTPESYAERSGPLLERDGSSRPRSGGSPRSTR